MVALILCSKYRLIHGSTCIENRQFFLCFYMNPTLVDLISLLIDKISKAVTLNQPSWDHHKIRKSKKILKIENFRLTKRLGSDE